MKQYINKDLGISLYKEKLQNGLEVHILPKEDSSQTMGVLSVNFGGNDNTFLDNENKENNLPLGTAHFLEHLLITQNGENSIKNTFLNNGGSVGAFTDYKSTNFIFSFANNISVFIEKLLSSLYIPEFTLKDIEIEKKIILEELLLYEDKKDWLIFNSLMKQMYPDSPISEDVAGTIDSIKLLNKKILDKAHSSYYIPNNMKLVVVGDVNPFDFSDLINRTFKKMDYLSPPRNTITRVYKKPAYLESKFPYENMHKQAGQFLIGVRETNYTNDISTLLSTRVGLDMYLGPGSEISTRLKELNLVNDDFGYSYTTGPNYSFISLSGTSNQIHDLKEKIITVINDVLKKEPEDINFHRTIKKAIGNKLLLLDSINKFTISYTNDLMDGMNFFEILEMLLKLESSCVQNRMRDLFNKNDNIYFEYNFKE